MDAWWKVSQRDTMVAVSSRDGKLEENDYEIGCCVGHPDKHCIMFHICRATPAFVFVENEVRDQLIPFAVRWYTGEAAPEASLVVVVALAIVCRGSW